MKIDLNDPSFVIGVIASLVAGVILAVIGIFLRMLAKSGLGLVDFFRRGVKEKTGLDTYRKTLESGKKSCCCTWGSIKTRSMPTSF